MIAPRRAGFALVELLAAVVLITVLIGLCVQSLSAVAQQLRRNQEQLAAIEAASSVMELVTALPDATIDNSVLTRPEIRELAEQTLSRWELTLQSSPAGEGLAGQRVELLLSRKTSVGDRPPLRLTAWRYRPEGPKP